MEYLKLTVGWIGWCFVHSYLIAPAVTKVLQEKLGTRYYWFRLIYNIVAVVSLVIIWRYQPIVNDTILFSWAGQLRFVQIPVFLLSIGLFFSGARNYDMLQFLGIRQLVEKRTTKVISSSGKFVASGIHRYTRHPWYLGGILIIWTGLVELTVSRLIMNSVLTLYFVVGACLEERKLVAEFGNEYRKYQEQVSMLLPLKRFRR